MITQRTHLAQHELEDIYVEVDGARVHSVRAGSGRPVLLIHGLTGSTINWRRNMAALAEEASVYAIDLLNMGASGRVAGVDASLAATAERVVACMDALGLAEADIAGHSHGGAISLMLAALYPERVRSLVLFAPANPYCSFGHGLIRFYNTAPGRLVARTIPYLPRWVTSIALGRMYGDPARIVAGTLEGYTDGLAIPGSVEHVLAIVRGWHRDMAELKAMLPRVADVPTLLVWGDRDRAVSMASGERLHREMRQSELVVVPTGGHVVFEELPEPCNRAMCAWLRRDHQVASRPLAVPVKKPSRSQSMGARAGVSARLPRLSTGV